MAKTDTVAPVARPRGDLSKDERRYLEGVMRRRAEAEDAYRKAVLACVEMSSFRAVSDVTGHSTDTLQRWKREAGK